jgi:hypothetical protein
MEIRFELEDRDDIVVEFDCDFLCENFSDREDLRWNLHNGNYTPIVANVFCGSSASESRTNSLLPTVRLRCGHDATEL